MALTPTPQRPSEKRAGGSGSPRRRLAKMLPMESMYELRRADMVKDTMALRATLDPRLMRAMTTPKTMDTMTALRGMFHPGLTCYKRSTSILKDLRDTLIGDRGDSKVDSTLVAPFL